MVDEQERCEWMNVSSGTGSIALSRIKGSKTVVCVNVEAHKDRYQVCRIGLNMLLKSNVDIRGLTNNFKAQHQQTSHCSAQEIF